jgi:hypothetical protein
MEDDVTHEQAAEQMREFEQSDELPRDLSEWPTGKAKYITFGEDGDDAYGEGPTAKLGPAEVEHHEDGSVTVAGEQANPDDFKGEPISSGVMEQIEESKRGYHEILDKHPELRDGKR